MERGQYILLRCGAIDAMPDNAMQYATAVRLRVQNLLLLWLWRYIVLAYRSLTLLVGKHHLESQSIRQLLLLEQRVIDWFDDCPLVVVYALLHRF